MKRILSSINKRSSPSLDGPANYAEDSPENIVLREVNAFCNEGHGPNNQGDEYVHLPSIVESAESSPVAAREAANLLRKLLSHPATAYGNVQYNAIMLMRILIDNPGHTFSRNIDSKFVSTVKELLREGRDLHVQRFLRETLDALEIQRAWDEDLALLLQMWKKEKGKMEKLVRSNTWSAPMGAQRGPNYFNHSDNSDQLPGPDELAARISEAKMTAKLLIQFVQSTPPSEMINNDLIGEFSGRCRRASRAIQNYIHATNPGPDEDTLLTLIETNDELSVALSKHQRLMLQARKAQGTQQDQQDQSPLQSESPSPQHPQLPQLPQHRQIVLEHTGSPVIGSPVSPQSAVADLSSLSGAVRPIPAPPLPQRTQTPPSPVSPVMTATRSATTRTTRSDVSAASNNGRYEYRSEEFQVQNPFADNYSITNTPGLAESEHEHEHERIGERDRDRWNESHQQPVRQT